MRSLSLNINRSEILWFGAATLMLGLIIVTCMLVLYSDEINQTEILAFIDGQHPIVVLYERPDTASAVSGLVEDGSRVIVVEYKPAERPDWVRVEQGPEHGWIQVSQLSRSPEG
jgi:hypothetical protein